MNTENKDNILIRYRMSDPATRIGILYKNYSNIDRITVACTESLVCRIYNQKEYSRKSKRDDLGVRIQTGNGFYSVTEQEAISKSEIKDTVISGVIEDDFLKDTDDPILLANEIEGLALLKKEFKSFNDQLGILTMTECDLLMDFLDRSRSTVSKGEASGLTISGYYKKILKIKRKLENALLPLLEKQEVPA